MTNYNKTLENRLKDLFHAGHMYGELGVTWEDPDVITLDTKQAITSLIKELVAEAKPFYYASPDKSEYQDGFNTCISLFEQNLLKVLGYEDEK